MNDIAYCPKPECLSPTVRQDLNDNNAICGQCRYEFCIKCEKGSHEGQSSTDPWTMHDHESISIERYELFHMTLNAIGRTYSRKLCGHRRGNGRSCKGLSWSERQKWYKDTGQTEKSIWWVPKDWRFYNEEKSRARKCCFLSSNTGAVFTRKIGINIHSMYSQMRNLSVHSVYIA